MAASLQVRCNAQTPEVRIYVPIGAATPGGGPDAGPQQLSLKEATYDKERKRLPVSEQDQEYGYPWTVDASGDFAVMPEAKDFLGRIVNKDWVSLESLAMGSKVSGIKLMFPIMSFDPFRARVVSECGL